MSYCAVTPLHLWREEDCLALALSVAAAKGGLNVNKNPDRARQFTVEWLKKDFDRVRDKVMPGQAAPLPPPERTVPVQEARKQLREEMQTVIAEGQQFNPWPHERMIQPKPSRMTVFADPAGVGKTAAAHAASTPEILKTEAIAFLSPTKTLSAESEARHSRRLSSLGAEDLTTHVAGRAHFCMNEEWDSRAKLFEAAGLSARDAVCKHCPDRPRCGYFEQTFWLEAGATYLQHGHAQTRLPGTPSFIICDDSPLADGAARSEENMPTARRPYTGPRSEGGRQTLVAAGRVDRRPATLV